MAKTGERYTTARAQLLRSAEPAGVSDDAFVKATGRKPEDWFAELDAWGARERTHGEIAKHLSEDLGVDGWWAQSVTVTYERARGMRDVGQRLDGTYSATASKTISAMTERAFDHFASEELRALWLPEGLLSVRTATRARSARFDWLDGDSRVIVGFEPKGDGRCIVAIEHERLPDAGAREQMKAFWREHLSGLKALLV
jgi:hypothetical protein